LWIGRIQSDVSGIPAAGARSGAKVRQLAILDKAALTAKVVDVKNAFVETDVDYIGVWPYTDVYRSITNFSLSPPAW